MELHVVTPEQLQVERMIEVANLVYAHVTSIHIRQKSWSVAQVELLARQLLHDSIPASTLVLNGHAALAARLRLGGAHLPQHAAMVDDYAGSAYRIGRSVHSLEGALAAEAEGCDYVFFGHVYETTCKPGIAARGLGLLEQLCSKLSIPVIAIGGIAPEHIGELYRAGASGIAVMSGIFEAQQPHRQMELYRQQMARCTVSDCRHQIQIGSDGI